MKFFPAFNYYFLCQFVYMLLFKLYRDSYDNKKSVEISAYKDNIYAIICIFLIHNFCKNRYLHM